MLVADEAKDVIRAAVDVEAEGQLQPGHLHYEVWVVVTCRGREEEGALRGCSVDGRAHEMYLMGSEILELVFDEGNLKYADWIL